MARCETKQHTSNNRKANKFGNGVTPVQERQRQKDRNFAKTDRISRGSAALTRAKDEQARAIAAFNAQSSRENFMWERTASKRVNNELQKLAQKSD